MLENIKAVIFDIDGTLADSMGVWSESDRILLGRRGIPYTEEVSFALKSMHFMSAVTYLKNLYSLPDSEESIAEEITDIVRDKYFHEVKLMPFVPEMIAHFKASGIKMCGSWQRVCWGTTAYLMSWSSSSPPMRQAPARRTRRYSICVPKGWERLPMKRQFLRILPMRQRQLLKTAFTLLA